LSMKTNSNAQLLTGSVSNETQKSQNNERSVRYRKIPDKKYTTAAEGTASTKKKNTKRTGSSSKHNQKHSVFLIRSNKSIAENNSLHFSNIPENPNISSSYSEKSTTTISSSQDHFNPDPTGGVYNTCYLPLDDRNLSNKNFLSTFPEKPDNSGISRTLLVEPSHFSPIEYHISLHTIPVVTSKFPSLSSSKNMPDFNTNSDSYTRHDSRSQKPKSPSLVPISFLIN
ncbi:hypothetical protein BB560_006156, partial [Smittium megazygosporum]